MKADDIAFAKYIGLEEENDTLSLDFKPEVHNHVRSIHASAQFALAETKSGLYLLNLFPELEEKVVPLLRDANIKYKKPALEKIVAYASIDDASLEKFKLLFDKKGRGSINVKVQVRDINEVLCSEGEFGWFIQKI